MNNKKKRKRESIMKNLKELYDYRQMIFSLVKKDLRGRYKGSAARLSVDLPESSAAAGGIQHRIFDDFPE